MTHRDRDAERRSAAYVLEKTWNLFDEVEQYVQGAGTVEQTERPDFAQRAKDLIPDSQRETEILLERSTLSQVSELVQTCTRCPLGSTRTCAVPGEGVTNARLMIVGEGPGAEEDASGRPFVGRAGVYLDSWLKAINLSRETNTYIANIVKCRPPSNRNPLPEEIQSCLPYLKRQIALVKPDAILCVGKVAAHALLDRSDALRAMRSTVHRFQGIPVLVTYHPAAVLRNMELRASVWEDLQRVAQLIDMPVHTTRR